MTGTPGNISAASFSICPMSSGVSIGGGLHVGALRAAASVHETAESVVLISTSSL